MNEGNEVTFSEINIRCLASCAALVGALTAGCGTAASHNQASDQAVAAQSSSPTPTPGEKQPAELPPNFIGIMARHGYVLTRGNADDASISVDAAIEQARQTFGLFQESDPSVAAYFLVSTPTGGHVKNDNDPNSTVEPDLDKTPMWVVYAQADMLKDENDPSLGWVRGTVVVLVDAITGRAEQAITF